MGVRARERFQPTSVCARTKERSGDRTSSTGIYMYFPFVCDPLDTRKPRHRKEGKGKLETVKEEPEKKERRWVPFYPTDLRHRQSLSPRNTPCSFRNSRFLLSGETRSRPGSSAGHPCTSLSLSLSLSVHFCKALFFRNAGPTIVFPVPPLRSSRLFHSFNLAALYKESVPYLSLSCFLPLIQSPRRFRTPFVLQRRVKSDWKVPAL